MKGTVKPRRVGLVALALAVLSAGFGAGWFAARSQRNPAVAYGCVKVAGWEIRAVHGRGPVWLECMKDGFVYPDKDTVGPTMLPDGK